MHLATGDNQESMKLEDFIPSTPEFTLSNGKTYGLRIPNLEDKVEMIRVCGGQSNIEKVFKDRDWSTICRLVYRLMTDKSDFMACKQTRVNDEGVEETVLVTGPIMLLRALKTQAEATDMLSAFNAASIASEPLVREALDAEVKKNLLATSTGETSSTPSPQSMDTLQSSSELLPTGS